MTSKQFDMALLKINSYYNLGLITKNERKEEVTKLIKEWNTTPKYW